MCCLPLLHTKYNLCHQWRFQPSGLLSGKKDRLAMWAESPGKKEVELNVPRRAGWRGRGKGWDWCHHAEEKQHCLAQMCTLTKMLPCLLLCAGWPEKFTREPFALLGMAVRVVSMAASFVSFCLSTAVPVLGTVSRFLPTCLRCVAPRGQPGLEFTRGISLPAGRSACEDVQGPCDREDSERSSRGLAAPVGGSQRWKTWFWHWGAWGPAEVAA